MNQFLKNREFVDPLDGTRLDVAIQEGVVCLFIARLFLFPLLSYCFLPERLSYCFLPKRKSLKASTLMLSVIASRIKTVAINDIVFIFIIEKFPENENEKKNDIKNNHNT